MQIKLERIESLEEISPTTYNVEEINSIEDKYPELRQASKTPSFLLQYGGSKYGLIKAGFTAEEAEQIETNYHTLYKESDDWVKAKIVEASKQGYVELAFGLRLRTPLLKETVLDTTKTLYQAEEEARTAGNAVSGQSYGLLNNRAAIGFMKRVKASKWKHDIKVIILIHDAIYLLVKDDIECLKWANDNLIEEMKWQELPEIQHDEIKLGANLEVYYPNWSNAIKIPNNASEEEILQVIHNNM